MSFYRALLLKAIKIVLKWPQHRALLVLNAHKINIMSQEFINIAFGKTDFINTLYPIKYHKQAYTHTETYISISFL